ncbi:MAG: recombinase family protein [Thermodesulfobacteriota bacterium]|nr:recombinase family protein [Thermodesulfobacteriota bacterium]
MLIGYARVSSDEQNLDLQLDTLRKAGCKKIFKDKLSGAKQDRPGLAEALQHLRTRDTLVIWKLDRLGRSVKGLIELVGKLQEEGVNFHSITDGIDTTTPAGRFFFHVMASLAQMERELLIERTRAGLAAAKSRGRVGGRKRLMTAGKVEAAKKLINEGMPPRDIAQSLGVSVPTLYRWCPASERA